jgi:hypothetical protein
MPDGTSALNCRLGALKVINIVLVVVALLLITNFAS